MSVGKIKGGTSISTQESMIETLVEREVMAVETDDGFLIFQADDEVFEPPVCVNKERFLELFSRFNKDIEATGGPV
jgi:hypothetical protein